EDVAERKRAQRDSAGLRAGSIPSARTVPRVSRLAVAVLTVAVLAVAGLAVAGLAVAGLAVPRLAVPRLAGGGDRRPSRRVGLAVSRLTFPVPVPGGPVGHRSPPLPPTAVASGPVPPQAGPPARANTCTIAR